MPKRALVGLLLRPTHVGDGVMTHPCAIDDSSTSFCAILWPLGGRLQAAAFMLTCVCVAVAI